MDIYKKLIKELNWYYIRYEDNKFYNFDNTIYDIKIKLLELLLKLDYKDINYDDYFYIIKNKFDYDSNIDIYDYLRDKYKKNKKINVIYERLLDLRYRLLVSEKIKINIIDILLEYFGNIRNKKYENFFKEHLLIYFNDINDFIYKIYEYNNCYFYDIYKYILLNPIFSEKEVKYKKLTIPKVLRIKVWNTYIGENIGKTKCLCCNEIDITQSIFECGHIIAEAKGGKTVLENLMPICSTCNKSMGVKNLYDFKNEIK
jgi:hypothetical protein